MADRYSHQRVMPAPEAYSAPHSGRPALGHVNLMVDTFIANAQVDDLRSIVRRLLASGIPNIGTTFTSAARERMLQSGATNQAIPDGIFEEYREAENLARPTDLFRRTLAQARCFYGAGLAFSGLRVLTGMVRLSVGLRWAKDGDTSRALTELDTDISQAIQSSKEQIECDRLAALEIMQDLRLALLESKSDVESWEGEFPFERAVASVEYWKM